MEEERIESDNQRLARQPRAGPFRLPCTSGTRRIQGRVISSRKLGPGEFAEFVL